jgi:beta-N-acetylhexosaminidase
VRGETSRLILLVWSQARLDAAGERWLRVLRPGGVVLAREALRSPAATRELLIRIKGAAGERIVLALEQEGGTENPLGALLPPLPSSRAAAERGLGTVRRLGELTGAAMKLLGCNTNLAPLLDLDSPSLPRESRSRTFSADPQEVARCGKAFLEGLTRSGVLACAKHFPGESNAIRIPDSTLPVSGKPMAALWREDLVPFRELLPKLPMVRLSHSWFKAYDFDASVPAALSSSVVTGLLRVKLDYAGAALSADLSSPPISDFCDPGDAAVKALRAGCDVVLVRPERVEAVVNALEGAWQTGGLSTERLSEAFSRLRGITRRLTLPAGKFPPRAFDRLAREFENFSKAFADEG